MSRAAGTRPRVDAPRAERARGGVDRLTAFVAGAVAGIAAFVVVAQGPWVAHAPSQTPPTPAGTPHGSDPGSPSWLGPTPHAADEVRPHHSWGTGT
jgi:hypothetical protein